MARILVIDDDIWLRESLARQLERAGHTAFVAAEGKAGVAIVAKERVDLVVTDLYMPGDDGITTIRHLRRVWPNLPIIVMSGGSAAGDLVAAALGLGARYALSKPFSKDELLSAIRVALGSGGSRKPGDDREAGAS